MHLKYEIKLHSSPVAVSPGQWRVRLELWTRKKGHKRKTWDIQLFVSPTPFQARQEWSKGEATIRFQLISVKSCRCEVLLTEVVLVLRRIELEMHLLATSLLVIVPNSSSRNCLFWLHPQISYYEALSGLALSSNNYFFTQLLTAADNNAYLHTYILTLDVEAGPQRGCAHKAKHRCICLESWYTVCIIYVWIWARISNIWRLFVFSYSYWFCGWYFNNYSMNIATSEYNNVFLAEVYLMCIPSQYD